MSVEDRDQLFEKALAQQLRAGKDASVAACLDAETLAAYHERLLPVEELSAAKKHLVSCARCQEILAQLELTQDLIESQDRQTVPVEMTRARSLAAAQQPSAKPDSAPSSKVSSFPARKYQSLRWAAPIGAIAAVLLLWVGSREFRAQKVVAPEPATQIADNRNESNLPAPAQPAAPSKEDRQESSTELYPGNKHLQIEPQNSPADQLGARTRRNRKDGTPPGIGFGSGAGVAPVENSKQETEAAAPDAVESAPAGGAAGGLMAKKSAVAPSAKPLSRAETKSSADRDKSDDFALKSGVTAGAAPATVPASPPPPPASLSKQPIGRLRGRVTDSAGSAVPGARVALKYENGNTVASTSTDNTGTYSFNGIASGDDYQLELQSAGFKSDTITGLNVAPGDNVMNAKLEVGASTETVEVSAQAVPLQTVVGANVSALSLNRRDFSRLVGLNIRIPAPGGKKIWSLGPGGQILFSKDGGRSWLPQLSGVSANLTTGVAPSDKVCWIAGTSGTLLRTTDGGKHWHHITVPISGDIGAVNASDANHASILDLTKNAKYETVDGGTTWQKSANP